MLLKALLSSLLTSVMAFPAPDADKSFDEAHGDMQIFKRDSVLEARDLELADIHGVNLTAMYKHSLIKRDDGDHIVIWVDRGFVEGNEKGDEGEEEEEEEEEDLVKRQGTRIAKSGRFRSGPSDWRRDHKRQDHTGPSGPYSGGVQAMYRWARAHSGGNFDVVSKDWQNLIIAGSNSGANALYRAKSVGGAKVPIGTQDLRNDADWTQKKARKFGSSWRASSKGGETCAITTRINYELIRTKYDV